MAILSKIRDRSGILIVVIGLAMFSFVVSPKDIIDFFSNKGQDAIGAVDGEKISYKDFATRVETLKSQQRNNYYPALQIENNVWNQIVREKLYEVKLEEAGVVIGEDAIWDAIINNQQVKSSPQFQSDGAFNEDLLKEYVANLQGDEQSQGNLEAWLNFEKAIKQDLAIQTYNDLIKAGVNVLTNEKVITDKVDDTKVSADYVYIPYTSIADEEVKVTENEVQEYINEHKNQFKTEAKRSLQFVKFPFTASKEDEEAIKTSLTEIIEDKEEYNKVTKATETVLGLRNTSDYKLFIEENDTDLPVNYSFQYKNEIPSVIKGDIEAGTVGTIVGPYKESKYYKVTKIADIQKIPDSVQASHILISYAGGQRAQSNVTRTKVEAEQLADSIYNVINKSSRKLKELAQEFSADPGSASKGGDLGWFGYKQMVPEFRDFCFSNSKGDVGVVETDYGFHVIRISGQKNKQEAYQLITVSRQIIASEETENGVFEQAETFAQDLQKGGSLADLAKEKKYSVANANDIKELDVYVGSLGQNRSVVRWAFNENTGLKSVKRFDLDEKGYAVVVVTDVQEKGLSSAKSAFSQVEPILLKEKKAEIIKGKMEQSSLEEIASSNNVKVENFKNVSLNAPTIPSVGIEPAVLSAAAVSAKDALINGVSGQKGVFAFVTKEIIEPTVDADKVNSNQASDRLKNNVTSRLFNGLKEGADITDNRAVRF